MLRHLVNQSLRAFLRPEAASIIVPWVSLLKFCFLFSYYFFTRTKLNFTQIKKVKYTKTPSSIQKKPEYLCEARDRVQVWGIPNLAT